MICNAKRITLGNGRSTRTITIPKSSLRDLGTPLLHGKTVVIEGEEWQVLEVENAEIVSRIQVRTETREPAIQQAVIEEEASNGAQAEYLSRAEMERLSGATPRQLQCWNEKGTLKVRQQGHRRLYTRYDALRVLLIVELRARRIPHRPIRGVLRSITLEMFEKTPPEEVLLAVFCDEKGKPKQAKLFEGQKAVLRAAAAGKYGICLVSITDLVARVENAYRKAAYA